MVIATGCGTIPGLTFWVKTGRMANVRQRVTQPFFKFVIIISMRLISG
jgi:hypothetical protein